MPDDPIDVKLERIHTVIQTERGPFPMRDFANFFGLFRIAYAASVEALVVREDLSSMVNRESVDRAISLTNEHLNSLSDEDIANFNERSMEIVEPMIFAIHRENPIDLIIGGILIALTVAVILSGGEIEISPERVKAKLPPFGSGIAKLKKALRL